jgi:hypothetical protein
MNWVLVKLLETSKLACGAFCKCVLCTLIQDVHKVTLCKNAAINWPVVIANYEYVEGEIIELGTNLYRAGMQPAHVHVEETMRCMLSAWFRIGLRAGNFMIDVESHEALVAAAEAQTSIQLSRRTGPLREVGAGVGSLWKGVRWTRNEDLDSGDTSPWMEDFRQFEDGQTTYRKNSLFVVLKNWAKFTFHAGRCNESVVFLVHRGTQEEMYAEEGNNELIMQPAGNSDPATWKMMIRQSTGTKMMVERRIQVYIQDRETQFRPSDGFACRDVFCCTDECLWELEDHIYAGHTHMDVSALASERYLKWPPALVLLRIGVDDRKCKHDGTKKHRCNDSAKQDARRVLSGKQVCAIMTLFPMEKCNSIFEFFAIKANTWGILGASMQRSECDAWFDSIFLGYDTCLDAVLDAAVDVTLSLMRFGMVGKDAGLRQSAEKLCRMHTFITKRWEHASRCTM